jgi:ABC-type phosphate transport system ATPase subunit
MIVAIFYTDGQVEPQNVMNHHHQKTIVTNAVTMVFFQPNPFDFNE